MIILEDIFQQINDLLPKAEKCKCYSVFPLPYNGYYELFVECDSGKRYRCLATKNSTLSNMLEMDFPAKGPQVSGVKK